MLNDYLSKDTMMQKGDILLFKDNSFLSRIIKKLSNGKYSHVAMCIGDNDRIIESNWNGIKIRKVEFQEFDHIDVFRYVNTNEYLQEQLTLTALNNLNLEYDYSLLLTIMLYKSLGILPKQSTKKFICSEFIDYVYFKNGIDIIKKEITNFVTPAEMGEILLSDERFKKLYNFFD